MAGEAAPSAPAAGRSASARDPRRRRRRGHPMLANRRTGEGSAPSAPGTPERVLEVALDPFAEEGFDGTPLGETAGRTGVTKAALH